MAHEIQIKGTCPIVSKVLCNNHFSVFPLWLLLPLPIYNDLSFINWQLQSTCILSSYEMEPSHLNKKHFTAITARCLVKRSHHIPLDVPDG